MFSWQAYIDDMIFTFRRHKEMAERAFGQLDSDSAFFTKPAEFSNSIAVIIKHLAGNLRSRWTDFLGSDGEKPWRDRDAEFIIGPEDTREHLLVAWEKGWDALLQTLQCLQEADAEKQVTIRAEAHTVPQAIHRSLTHVAYHVGQIVYLARMLTTGNWQWLTIPPGKSKEARTYLRS